MSHDQIEPRALELAKYRLQVANEDLEVAKDNFGKSFFRAANNRAYYSIYHSITAVLALEQKAFKRHKDTLAYFNKEYVRTDIFPRELGHQISVAEEVRHASDYDEFYVASKEECFRQIQCAEALFEAVKKYVLAEKE
jgi:uncharacterized protein (UPF0332 family)